jgi:hypothetical protein
MTACVMKLFHEQQEEGRAVKLTRKQFRKGFAALGAQLSDSDEGLIFEALGESMEGDGCECVCVCMGVCVWGGGGRRREIRTLDEIVTGIRSVSLASLGLGQGQFGYSTLSRMIYSIKLIYCCEVYHSFTKLST